jgi:hypothetical protein
MFSRLIAFFSILLGISGASLAQQAACKAVEVPVGVIGVTGEVFRGLAAEDFIGQVQKKAVGVKSLAYDEGARRVLFVVDTNKKLSADSRKAEAEMIQTMVAAGRPEDTFALHTAHGPGDEIKFTSDRNAITRALNQENNAQRGKEAGVLDAVMEGIEWFGTPQFGDSIVVIAADTEGNHKANEKMVSKALDAHHIRMFGLALGPVATRNSMVSGTMTSTTSQGLAWTEPLVGEVVYQTGDEHFFPLSVNSGGLLLAVMNTDPRHTYRMADAHLAQQVRQKALSVSRMINTFYRMEIEPPRLSRPEGWNLDVNDAIKKASKQMFVLYPRELGPC